MAISSFQCGLPKTESEEMVAEGLTEVGLVPSDTLLLRGLPRRCRSEDIIEALSKVSTHKPTAVHIARSAKFAYAQFASAAEVCWLDPCILLL